MIPPLIIGQNTLTLTQPQADGGVNGSVDCLAIIVGVVVIENAVIF